VARTDVGQALTEARLSPTLEYRQIIQATYGLVFFATPHHGGNFASFGDIASKIVRKVLHNPDNTFIEVLRTDSFYSDEINENFNRLLGNFKVVSFFEGLQHNGIGVIVDRSSAVLNQPDEERLGIEADHVNICRFATADDDTYQQVEGNIVRLAGNAVANRNAHLRLNALPSAASLAISPTNIPEQSTADTSTS